MLAILRPHSEQKLIRRQIISSDSWIHQKFQMKSKILAEFQLLAVIFVDGIVPGNGRGGWLFGKCRQYCTKQECNPCSKVTKCFDGKQYRSCMYYTLCCVIKTYCCH